MKLTKYEAPSRDRCRIGPQTSEWTKSSGVDSLGADVRCDAATCLPYWQCSQNWWFEKESLGMYLALNRCVMSACWGVRVICAIAMTRGYQLETSYPLWVWRNVPSVLKQARGSLCGASTLLMRIRHGCRLRQVVRLRSMVLRAQERVGDCVVQV